MEVWWLDVLLELPFDYPSYDFLFSLVSPYKNVTKLRFRSDRMNTSNDHSSLSICDYSPDYSSLSSLISMYSSVLLLSHQCTSLPSHVSIKGRSCQWYSISHSDLPHFRPLFTRPEARFGISSPLPFCTSCIQTHTHFSFTSSNRAYLLPSHLPSSYYLPPPLPLLPFIPPFLLQYSDSLASSQ